MRFSLFFNIKYLKSRVYFTLIAHLTQTSHNLSTEKSHMAISTILDSTGLQVSVTIWLYSSGINLLSLQKNCVKKIKSERSIPYLKNHSSLGNLKAYCFLFKTTLYKYTKRTNQSSMALYI